MKIPVLPFIAALCLAGCSASGLVGAPSVYPEGSEPFKDTPPGHRNNLVPMIYVTDRLPEVTAQFGMGPLPWEVFATESLKEKREVDLSLKITKAKELGRFPESPGLAMPVGLSIVERKDQTADNVARAKFYSVLKDAVAKGTRKEVYVYIPGYQQNFEASAMTLANLWHFLGRDGVAILYSWPANSSYAYSRESADFTQYHLREFLKVVGSSPDIEKIHLIAHSRAGDLVLGALRDVLLSTGGDLAKTRLDLKLDTLLLAAPDIDSDSLAVKLSGDRLRYLPRRMVIYTGPGEGTGGASTWFSSSTVKLADLKDSEFPPGLPEAALKPPQLQIVLCQIRQTNTYDALSAHPGVLSDVILVLRDHKDPGAENGRPLGRQQNMFWTLTDEYLRKPPAGAPAPAATPAPAPAPSK
jgi:esterase/lipase superfamily enzyme